MRYFLDTEFIESGPFKPVSLISVALVREDGHFLYLEDRDSPLEDANVWVRENVIPHLDMVKSGNRESVKSRSQIRSEILQFIGDSVPEFWGYYSDYDWVVFCQIFGTVMNLPKGWPMYCRDLKQWCDVLATTDLPQQATTEHNALFDARWNLQVWEFINNSTIITTQY